jgi:predicted acyl esterase
MCPTVFKAFLGYCTRTKLSALCLLHLFSGGGLAQTATSPQTHQVMMRDGICLAADVYGSTLQVRRPVLRKNYPGSING